MKTLYKRPFLLSILLVALTGAIATGAELEIGGILTIEGNITLVDNGTQETGAAGQLDVFIGEGDAILGDGSINPLARGLLITDAVAGVVKVGTDYAVVATGNGMVIGVSGVTLAGTIQARVNIFQTAVNETILVEGTSDFVNVSFNSSEIASPTGDPFYGILGNAIAIDTLGQTISTDLNVRKIVLDPGGTMEEALSFGLSNGVTTFGDGITDIVTMTDLFGDLLILSDGAAALLNGNFSSPALTSSGSFSLRINTDSQPVDAEYDLDGDIRSLLVQPGPIVEIVADATLLSVLGQDFTGQFIFRQDPGGNVVAQASGVLCSLGNEVPELLSLNDGSGILLLTPTGTGVDIQGPVSFSDPQISTFAIFSLQINSTGSAINETIDIGGTSQFLSLEGDDFVRIQAVNAQLSILDSELIGDFQFFGDGSGQIRGLFENGLHLLNDGLNDVLLVDNGSGAILMNSSGTGMEFSGEVLIIDPQISTAGSFSVSINTGTQAINETLIIGGLAVTLDLAPGPYVRVTGFGSSLIIDGEPIAGDLIFEQQSSAPVAITVFDGIYTQGGGIVDMASAQGAMLLSSDGIAGELSGFTNLSIPGVSVSSTFALQVNTTGQAVDSLVDVGGTATSISLPAGFYIRIIGPGAFFEIAGQFLSGNMVFEETSPSTVDLTLSSVSFDMGSGVFVVSDSNGLLKVDSSGAAGALVLPNNSFNSASVSLSGTADLALINTRPTQVIGTFDLGSEVLGLDLPAGPYFRVPFFDANLILNRLFIGGLAVSVTGEVVLEPFGGLAKMIIENADVAGNGTTLTLGTGAGDMSLTEGGLSVVLRGPTIDYGVSLDQSLSITAGDFSVSSPVALRIHPGALQSGEVTLIDFSLATSSVTELDFTVSPSLPAGFSLVVSGNQLRLSSPVKPDSDNDGLSDAWEDEFGPDTTSLLPTDNSDGDKLNALAEFALGLNPTINDSPKLIPTIAAINGQEYLTLTYPRNAEAIGLVGIFTERSTDLGDTDPWSIDETTFESSTATEVTDRSIFPFTSNTKDFLRLKFIQP